MEKEPGRLERQSGGMSLDEMLDDLPSACDRGAKRNAKGFLVAWRGYKIPPRCRPTSRAEPRPNPFTAPREKGLYCWYENRCVHPR